MDRESGNHAKLLPVFVEEMLSEVRAKGLQINAVALSEGPGSYTGLRIGTSTAKGLCYGLNVPLIPVPTPEVLCASLAGEHPLPENCYLMPMIDARRMEVYTGVYSLQAGAKMPEQFGKIEARIIENSGSADFGQKVSGENELFFFGDGAAKCEAVLAAEHVHFVPDVVPNAAYMAALAEAYFQSGKACVAVNEVAYYEPFYLKEFVAAKSHVKGLDN